MRSVVVCGVGHNIRCKAISHENFGGDPVWRCPRKVQKIFVELCSWYLWRCNAKCIVWVTQLKFVSSVHFVVVNNVCILRACILSFCILSPCHLSLYHLSVYQLSGYPFEALGLKVCTSNFQKDSAKHLAETGKNRQNHVILCSYLLLSVGS